MLEKLEAPKNALLLSLGRSELEAICVDLQRADLVPYEKLTGRNSPCDGIWFPESGFISMLMNDSRGSATEVAVIGRESAISMLSQKAILNMSPHFVAQHRGVAHFVAAERVQTVLDRAPTLARILQTATNSLLYQIASTAHANARGTVAQRLARWLLMAHDRLDGDVIFVTHDILGSMLGVRRVGVTNAIHVLEGEKLVRAFRGRIRILDRSKLILAANNLYTPCENLTTLLSERSSGQPVAGRQDGLEQLDVSSSDVDV